MEIGSGTLLGSGSRCCAWILIAPLVLLCCCCCLPFATAGFFIVTPQKNIHIRPLPTLDKIPPVQTVPVIPAIPTKTPAPGSSLPLLDPDAIPIFGSATLESGFSPDPYTVDVEAGGSVDTAKFSPACGTTSYHPAFVLDWETGDVPGSFLRIFFTPDDEADTTLLVHTPEGEWLCEDDSAYGKGTDPVLDLPSAAAGEYAIWVGTQQGKTSAQGSLSITGSMDVTP
jgi:hypothetical protein